MQDQNIRFITRTFGELEKGLVPPVKDPYGIMASLGPKMKEAILHNPSGYSQEEVCQLLALDGDIVIGATNPFSGRLLINNTVTPTQTGSYLYAHENYRKNNVGGDLFYKETRLHPSKNNFYAGISQMAIGLYRALKFTLFEFPRLIYLRKSRSVIQNYLRSKSWWTKPLIALADFGLWTHRSLLKLIGNLRYRDYSIEETTSCPEEVEKIILQDEHPFMELHDQAWFNWCLNYSISEDERTLRRLFLIKHLGVIEGFLLIKQEYFEQASSRGFKDIYLGSVMEWGITPMSKLKEKDIAIISLGCFDKTVDGIQFASTNLRTISHLKRKLFVQVGNANIGFRIHSFKDEQLKDINKWRIRLAAGDTVLN